MVIVPLLSLLQDQLRRLREGPLRVAALMGAQEMPERRQILHGLAAREIDVLFTTPEALAALLAAGTVERRRRGFVPARLIAPRGHQVTELQSGSSDSPV